LERIIVLRCYFLWTSMSYCFFLFVSMAAVWCSSMLNALTLLFLLANRVILGVWMVMW
jgi:hypothetical protein